MKNDAMSVKVLALLFLVLASLHVTPAQAATFSSGSSLTLDLAALESVAIVSSTTEYSLTLNGTTWGGTDTSDVTGNGTNTLTVDANAFADIQITDSGAGTSVIFGNSAGGSYSEGFNIALDNGSGSIAFDGAVSITSGGLSAVANSTTIDANITTVDSDISLSVDGIEIAATVNAGTGIVTLAPQTAGRAVDLGTETAGSLSLTDAEIDQITAGILRIGSSNAGDINFTTLITPAGIATLSLITGDQLLNDNNGLDVQVASLALQTINGIGNDSQIDMDVDTVAALNTTGGGIALIESFNGGDLIVGTVDGVVGLRNEASTGFSPLLAIQLETNNGDLTVNADIFTSRRNMFIVAQERNGREGDKTFTNNANIINTDSGASTSNAKIDIRANNITLAPGSTVSAQNRVILEGDPEATVSIGINLGGVDGVNTVGLTDAELDTVSTAGTLQIGNINIGGTDEITVTSPIDLTDGPSIPTTDLLGGAAIAGSGANVLTANALNLAASTSIGSSGDPFAFNATALTTASSGDQFLSEEDSLIIGDADLNAGVGNAIELVSGTFLTTDEGVIENDTSVLDGATLGGTGAVNGTVTVQSSGAVAPGASPGVLDCGDVDFGSGSNFNVEVNGLSTAGANYDQLNVTGSVTIDSGATLLTSGTQSGVANGATIVIINNDGGDAVAGTFSGLAEQATVSINGQDFRISYSGGDGNDVVLTDSAAPTLLSFTRQNPAMSPTSADILVFRATFDEDVQNVDATDFVVNGATTATVTNVSAVNARVYDVTVSGGDLADFLGEVGLNLSGSQNIEDSVGNVLPNGEPAADQTYTISNAPGFVVSFTRRTPPTSPTDADSLVFRVTFSEGVQNVDASDFAVNGATTATVTDVTAVSASVYDVTVSGGDLADFQGEVGLDLSGSQDIQDLLGQPVFAGEPATDETYTVNNLPGDDAPPFVSSFARQDPATSPTDADSLIFRVTFNEDVVNVDAANFVVNGTTTATVTDVTAVSASVYDVTVSGGDLADLQGEVGLDLSGSQDIEDLAGNALFAGEPDSDETYTIDNLLSDSTPPFVSSFTRQVPATSPTDADSLIFRATCSEDVVNVDAADFAVSGTTTATVTDVTAVSASVYDVTVSGGDLADFQGEVGLDLSGSQDIQDLAGNALLGGEPLSDETYTIDNDGGSCAMAEFSCEDGSCIQLSLECDGVPQCPDSSDETPLNANCCTESDFLCENGACLDPTFTCDGIDDCGDGSDEYPANPDCPMDPDVDVGADAGADDDAGAGDAGADDDAGVSGGAGTGGGAAGAGAAGAGAAGAGAGGGVAGASGGAEAGGGDAGASGGNAGATDSGGAADAGETPTDGNDRDEDAGDSGVDGADSGGSSGCNCSVPGSTSAPGAVLSVWAALVLPWLRRRSRSRRLTPK